MPDQPTFADAVRALGRHPDQVGMGVFARHLDRQFAAAHRAPPIPAWAMPAAINPLEQTVNADQEN